MRAALISQYYSSQEYLAKLRRKANAMKEMEADEYTRTAKILESYSVDPIAFIEDFVFIKMTEGGGDPKPFFLFQYQKDIILKIQEAENLNQDIEYLIDKPRGMGLTWLISAYFLWRWLFTENYSAFILSRTETEVDDGSRIADNCYDDQTEVLTENGWKLFKDLNKTERVMTFNKDTQTYELHKPIRYIDNEYSGDMYRIKSRSMDLLVTPKHKFLVKSDKGFWRFKEAEYIYKHPQGYGIPSLGNWVGKDNESFSKDDCAILGMYLSEGWLSNTRNINFAQTAGLKGGKSGWKGDVRKDFIEILNRRKNVVPHKWIKKQNESYYISKSDLFVSFLDEKWFLFLKKEVGDNSINKRIPTWVKNLSKEKLEVLLDWLVKGDGYKRGNTICYSTTSKQLADDVQEIGLRCGYSKVNISVCKRSEKNPKHNDLYNVNLGSRNNKFTKFTDGRSKNFVEKTKYLGRIYCVEVKNNTVVVRRNGKVVISGNSIFGKIRYMIDHLPPWILPPSYQPKITRGTPTDMGLKLINPDMGTAIIGSSTNSNAGRSRRYRTTFIDECFSIERFNEVYRSLQSVSRLKLFVSTVKPGRQFEQFMKMCKANDAYISLTWKQHPFKDQEWYEEQIKKAEFDPEVMKEIEADYSIDPRSQYYPEVKDAKVMPLEYDRQRPLYVSIDIGRQDLTVILYWQYDGMFKLVEAYFNKLRPIDWYVPFLNPEALWNPEDYNEYQRKFIERFKSWKKPVAYFGEQAHTLKVMPLNVSSQDVLNKYGIRLLYNPNAINHPPRRMATSVNLSRTIFNQASDSVMRTYDAIAQSRYAGSTHTSTEVLRPVHDNELADFRAAVENFFVCVPRLFRVQRDEIPQEDKSFASGIIKRLKM
jgi:hypothetical protein